MATTNKTERERVLDLLEAEKITVDEAVEILEAMGEGGLREQAGAVGGDVDGTARQGKPTPDAPAQGPRHWNWQWQQPDDGYAGTGFQMGMPQGVAKMLKGLLSNLPTGGARRGERRTLKETLEGSLNPQGDISLVTRYGKLAVETWEEETFRLELKVAYPVNQYGDDASLADLLSVERAEGQLSIVPRSGSVQLKLVAKVPRQQYGQVQLENTYGKLVVEGLRAETLEVCNTYGRIRVDRVQAERVGIRQQYGSVSAHVEAAAVEAESQYGAVKLSVVPAVAEATASVRSEYGRVRVALPDGCRYELEAATRSKIKIGLPVEERSESGRKTRRVSARGGDPGSPVGIRLQAATKFGRIELVKAEGGEPA